MTLADQENSRFNVHVSHCDANSDVVDRLSRALLKTEYFDVSTSSDKQPLRRNWKSSFSRLIAEADAVLIVLSPEAAASETLIWQIETALDMSKQMIPVIAGRMHRIRMPDELADIKPVHLEDPRVFVQGVQSLVNMLDGNADWTRSHTWLYGRARAWHAAGRPDELLLNQTDADAAKAWTFERPNDASKPTNLHLEFILASGQVERSEQDVSNVSHVSSDAEALLPKLPAVERKQTPRKLNWAKDSKAKHGSSVEGRAVDRAGQDEQTSLNNETTGPAASHDPLEVEAASVRQTPTPLQVVLGTALVTLTGIAAWQTISDTARVSIDAHQVVTSEPVRSALANRLFYDQTDQLEEAISKIDCLLTASRDNTGLCTNKFTSQPTQGTAKLTE